MLPPALPPLDLPVHPELLHQPPWHMDPPGPERVPGLPERGHHPGQAPEQALLPQGHQPPSWHKDQPERAQRPAREPGPHQGLAQEPASWHKDQRVPVPRPLIQKLYDSSSAQWRRDLKTPPIVAIVDTNCDPDLIDYPIAGNDDAIKSIQTIVGAIGETVAQAKGEHSAITGQTEEAPAAAEAPAAEETAEAAPAAEATPEA